MTGPARLDRSSAGSSDRRRAIARTITLVATMRNEGPFLLEWVAYHRLIGFNDVLICTNDCVDGSPELLDALQNHGLLRHLRVV
jgi:hypothetical protein